VLIAIALYAVVGTLLPDIAYLAPGQLIIGFFGPWIALLSIFATYVSFRRWQRHHRIGRLLATACAAFAAVGSMGVVASQLSAIRATGADVSLASAFSVLPQAHRSLTPASETYGSYDGRPLPLAIYPTGRHSALSPVLVYIHGGGWISGGLRQRDFDMRWFADQGLLGVSVEYTLSDANRHHGDLTQAQIGCALVWIGANIRKYGGDPARIAMIGESAGGNLVINVGYMANQQKLHATCPGQVPRVSAVVALYPVIDVADFYRNGRGGFPIGAKVMAGDYTGGTPEQYPDRYAAVSSAPHISALAPPTMVIVGSHDTLVPPPPAFAFVQKAREAGVAIQLITIPYAGHAFDFMPGSINNQLTRSATLHLLAAQGLAP